MLLVLLVLVLVLVLLLGKPNRQTLHSSADSSLPCRRASS